MAGRRAPLIRVAYVLLLTGPEDIIASTAIYRVVLLGCEPTNPPRSRIISRRPMCKRAVSLQGTASQARGVLGKEAELQVLVLRITTKNQPSQPNLATSREHPKVLLVRLNHEQKSIVLRLLGGASVVNGQDSKWQANGQRAL